MLRATLIVSFALYLGLVRLLRFRRLRRLQRTYNAKAGTLTPLEAQKIVQEVVLCETPLLMALGVQAALFQSYGLPEVATLLVKNGQFKSEESLSKRIADTATLVSTWIACPLVYPEDSGRRQPELDPRSAIAIARVNWLHGRYKISNESMLYTLGLFAFKPIEWTNKFNWRSLSHIEEQALYIFWSEIGRRMDIVEIPPTSQEFRRWCEEYEETQSVPTRAARELGRNSISFLQKHVPSIPGLRPLIKEIFIATLDGNLRAAMMMPPPRPAVQAIIHAVFRIRAFIVLHFCLPRRTPVRYVTTGSPPPSVWNHENQPRIKAAYRRPFPWYYPESKGLRRILERLQVWLAIRSADTLPGEKWRSAGYRLEEIGPVIFEKDGHDKVMHDAARILGRPVTGPWSLHPPMDK